MNLRVQLEQFEGPLDLLLYLVRKEEMDIFDINIVQITKQYLDFIRMMKELDLEVAGDFIAMASTLIQIKSRMLLPQYDDNGEIVEAEDPRKELVQKLLEYEKYKEASKMLYDRPLLNRDQWARGIREKIEVTDDSIELEDNALFSLIGYYRKAMKAVHKRIHKVTVKLQSISSRILEIKDRLIVGQQVVMRDLINSALDTKEKARQSLITFLSLLELGKLEYVSIYQTENYGDIYVTTKKVIENDVVSKTEDYDHLNADQVAQQMAQKAQKIESLESLDFIEDSLAGTSTKASDDNEQLNLQDLSAETIALADHSFIESEDLDSSGFSDDLLDEEVATDEEILAAELSDLEGNTDLNLKAEKSEPEAEQA